MTGAFGGSLGDTRFPGIGFLGGQGCSGSLQHVSTPSGKTPIEIAIISLPVSVLTFPAKLAERSRMARLVSAWAEAHRLACWLVTGDSLAC